MHSETCPKRETIIIHNYTNDTSTPNDYSNYEEPLKNRKTRRKMKALQRRSKNVGKF